MKLISVPASPFARKARILIIELGLQDRVEITDPGVVTPVSNNEAHWQTFIDHQEEKILRGLAQLEQQCGPN